MHSVQRLYEYRKSISTKPFNARGKKVVRCRKCQVAKDNCICNIAQTVSSNAAFVLLMHDAEILKPSNTARLIADLFDETYAFIWSRTKPPAELLALLKEEQYLPFVVFPKMYAQDNRIVHNNQLPMHSLTNKKPLFILLDGSWREAKKMFRKSPYLDGFAMASFEASNIENSNEKESVVSESCTGDFIIGDYIRESMVENQLATAQVASRMLNIFGEHHNAKLLSLWFDTFNFQYQKSVCQTNRGQADAMERFVNAQKSIK